MTEIIVINTVTKEERTIGSNKVSILIHYLERLPDMHLWSVKNTSNN